MRRYLVAVFMVSFAVVLFSRFGFAEEGYTPLGAEVGGNATGEITPYVGGKGLVCPSDYENGDFLPNPYKDEKPLVRIDHTNLDQHQHRLTPGQIARLKRNPDYYMTVYPTHRNTEYLPEYIAATKKSAKSSYLDENNMLQGYQGGIPFPRPKNGLEAIWNVKRPYTGDDSLVVECRRIVSPSGKVKKTMRTSYVITYDERRLRGKLENPDKCSYKIKSFYTYPADEAGTALLTVGYLDDDKLEDTWLYLPALRRVRRAPTLVGGGQLEGETTMDELGMEFRGPLNDWTWKLLGKKEIYIPVNCYDMWEVGASDKEECLPNDLNPFGVRHELRRVWAVEGTLTEGVSHPYSKRVGYYDEDTWQPAAMERYDQRGNLWRMGEWYTSYDYCEKFRTVVGYIYLNLETGRYELYGGCRTKDTFTAKYYTGIAESEFTVQSLRKSGR